MGPKYKLIYPSYDEMHDASVELARKLKKKKLPLKKLVIVSRGGLLAGSIIGYELGIQDCDIVAASSYVGRSVSKIRVYRGPKIKEPVVVIDDIVDRGGTARALKKLMPKMHLAVLYVKPRGQKLAGSYVKRVSQNTWPVFPWDTEDQKNH